MHFTTFILKNLTRRPVRTVLTVLGLAVAVGSMIALLGVSHNVERSVTESFEHRGVDLVAMEKGKTDQLSSDLDEKIIERVRKLDGVDRVDAALAALTDITTSGGSSIPTLSFGWPPENFGYEDLKLLAGRQLTAGDTNKAMLGKQLAENLRKGVGDRVELQQEQFEVVGVYESFNVYDNGAVIIPLKDAQRLAAREGRITGFSIRVAKNTADPQAEVEAVRRRIENMTDPETGKPVRVSALTVKDYVSTSSHIRVLRALVWVVSVIALAIGVISMLNTMVMAVLERTQEIGILRAVGWTRARVVKMVLGEAVLTALAAAAVGTVGAIAATHLLAASPKVSGFIEPGVAPAVVAQGFALTVLIGLVGGAYPALRAARLLPTEAIRHD
jgi:putative ABC transport system permease protein